MVYRVYEENRIWKFVNLLNFLDQVSLVEGETQRTNCPCCGGRNTFTISKKLGNLVWNCYKASCDCSGKKQTQLSSDDIRTRLLMSQGKWEENITVNTFTVPDYIVKRSSPLLDDYVTQYNLEPEDVWLDIRENRAVFLVHDVDGELVGAVGRSLLGELPKWKRYDTNKDIMYFTNDNKELGVLVEDCVSACSVDSAGYTGIALLGTTMHESRIKDLVPFKEVVIALDKDASKKSLKIKKMLDPYVKCRVALLPDDLKYFPPAIIQDIISQSLCPSL